MLKVGITGGIGSGKTTVCKIFETLGIPVFYADDVAKQIMVTDKVLVNGIKQTFGQESYFGDGSLNRQQLSKIVFNDEVQLKKLNALVHPAVFRAFDVWESTVDPRVTYTLKEAALLFESGSYKMCDVNILVTAPIEQKISRVMQRDGLTRAAVLARMDKQLSDAEKLEMADETIENTENQSLILQVLALHQKFLNQK